MIFDILYLKFDIRNSIFVLDNEQQTSKTEHQI